MSLFCLCDGDDCGIQLYLFALIVPANYIRLTNHSARFQRWFYITLSCVYLVFYLLFDEVLDLLITPLDQMDRFGPESEMLFTVLNVLSSLVIILVTNYLFAEYFQKTVQRNEDLEHDFLTGLKNRHGMEPILEAAYQKWLEKGQVFSVCLGDVDHFKQVNDQHGHEAGDHILNWLGQFMEAHMPTGAVACRWGGEEFLFLCPWSQQEAYVRMEHLRQDVERERVSYEGKDIPVTMTFGLATVQPGQDVSDLIRSADRELYYGKEHGRNQTVCAHRIPGEAQQGG